MSRPSADLALDALLAELRPPPLPAGFADRVAAAALGQPQRPASGAAPRHARRWLRRPLFVGGAALGLAFASAVAASLAGVPMPRPVAAVLEKLPLVGKAAPAPEAPAPAPALPRRLSVRPEPAPDLPKPARAQPPPPLVVPPRLERRIERMERRQDIVAARRAAGLPTPRADRLEAQRERIREIVAARRAAGLPTPRADRMEAREARLRQLLEERRRQRASGPGAAAEPAEDKDGPASS